MAECASMPSCVRPMSLHIRSRSFPVKPRNVYAQLLKREQFSWKSSLVSQRLLLELHGGVDLLYAGWEERSLYLKRTSSRCYCFGVMSPENLGALNWVPIADQVLLLASIIFAYAAGVIPHKRFLGGSSKTRIIEERASEDLTTYGRSMKSESSTNPSYSWGEVKLKLMDALSAVHRKSVAGGFAGRNINNKENNIRHPLSLLAIAEGPRLRLLLATLQHLQKEVDGISQVHEADDANVWLLISSKIVKESVMPICINWLKEEITLENEEPNMDILSRVSQKLKGDETVLMDINRSGKTELYADLLFYLKLGSIRRGYCHDLKFLDQHTVNILEDMIIMLADAVTNIILELISVDSSMSSEMNGVVSSLCSLSTRALQRLRNEVALNQWIQQNFESVISMYEDRFDLFVFCKRQIVYPLASKDEKHIWWKKLAFQRSTTSSLLNHVYISSYTLPAKRTKELRTLTGWRYYFSLFLEFSDIAMPFVRAVTAKVSNAVSFFLVYLIGRSLGLIYTGIRQALGWRCKELVIFGDQPTRIGGTAVIVLQDLNHISPCRITFLR